jgi:pectinesterase
MDPEFPPAAGCASGLWILVLLLSCGPLKAQDNRLRAQDKQHAQKAAAPAFPTSFTVAQDGSGNFKTIQEAVNSVRDLSQVQVKIYIRRGVYHEKVVVPSWKTNISLVGEDADSTVITNDDYSGKAYPCGHDPSGKDKFNTFTSYTVLVQGNDFSADNLTIRNAAGRVGQAVALHVEGDRCRITHCRLLGNQDTLYAAREDSRELYEDCYIEGTTDFIFGEATVVFERCTLKSLTNSFITAAATRSGHPFGFVFLDCRLTADTSVAHKVYLGRPWRPYSNVVYIHTEMGGHIAAAGWDNWKNPENEKTAFYAEYASTGPGGSVSGRAPWSRQLSEKEAKQYTIHNILSGRDGWKP